MPPSPSWVDQAIAQRRRVAARNGTQIHFPKEGSSGTVVPRMTVREAHELAEFWSQASHDNSRTGLALAQAPGGARVHFQSARRRWQVFAEALGEVVADERMSPAMAADFWHELERIAIAMDSIDAIPSAGELAFSSVGESLGQLGDGVMNLLKVVAGVVIALAVLAVARN